IPAVLLEAAYLSNPAEESLLRNSDFQKRLAKAVASSIREYFVGSASIYEYITTKNKETEKSAGNKIATRKYTIKRGDTLSSVAKNYDTSIAILLKINNMKISDRIYVGRKILVPDVNAKNVKKYTVKKGDTLYSLARNNSITI